MKLVTLDSVLTFHRGITFKPDDKVAVGSSDSVVCFRTKNIQKELDESDLLAVPSSFVKRDELYVNQGDILISTANSWELVGKCVRVAKTQYKSTIGGFISMLRPKTELIDPDYLYRFLSMEVTQERIRHLGKKTTNISNLDRVRFLQLKIPLPPLETQKQIAAVLEKADRLRKDCQQMEQELNSLAQSVFIDMFGDPVTNPKNWEVKSLIDLLVSKPQIGTTTPSHDGGTQSVVRVGELGKYEVNYKKCGPITLEGTALEKYKLFEGDYLLARAIGSRDHLGKASLFVEQKGTYVYDSHVMRLRFNDDLMSSQFFYELMKTHGGRSLFLNSSAQTAVQFNINAKQISQIELPVPPAELQNDFLGKLNEIKNLLRLNSINLAELNTNFDSLMQKAFKGELNL